MLTRKKGVGIISGHQARKRMARSLKTKQERQFKKEKAKKSIEKSNGEFDPGSG